MRDIARKGRTRSVAFFSIIFWGAKYRRTVARKKSEEFACGELTENKVLPHRATSIERGLSNEVPEAVCEDSPASE